MGDRDEGVKLFVYGVSSSCPKDLLESEFGKLLYNNNGRRRNLKVKIILLFQNGDFSFLFTGKCGRVNDIFNSGKGFVFITMADERDAKIACEGSYKSKLRQ